MPLYEYCCTTCEKRQSRFLPVSQYKAKQYCDNPACGQFVADGAGLNVDHPQEPLVKLVCAPAVFGDYEEYISPATGKLVRGKQQHLEDLKQSGCRIFEPGERQQEIKKSQERQANLEKHIDECVEKTAAQLGYNS